MLEHYEFLLNGNQSISGDATAMYRKHSSSSNSSSSAATSPQHNQFPNSTSTFFDDSSSPQSSSTSASSPPMSVQPSVVTVPSTVPKQEPPDHCEHWKILFPPGPKDVLPKNVCPDVCEVCGDVATGYHYEVPSCNGCKTFFRRAVLGQRQFACKKNGECKNNMDKEIRVKCRKCRFDRCVEAGMNPLAILSETNPEGNTVVRDILSKRKMLPEQQQLQVMHADQPSTSNASFKVFISPQVMESTMDRLIDELMHLEFAVDKIRKSNHTVEGRTGLTLNSALEGHSQLGYDWGVAPPRVKMHGKPPWKFIPLEKRIRERIPFGPPPHKHDHKEGGYPRPKMWPLLDLVHAIEYLKTFDFFHKLPENDKRTLAKNVTIMTVYITNSFYAFEAKSDVTIHPDGCIPHGGQILEWAGHEDAKHDLQMHYETVQRVKALNLDKKEYVLIKALITCNPAIEDLTSASREIMQEQRDRYAKSLMSYVMARRGFLDGPSTYTEIMAHVDWLTRLAKRNKDIHVLICALGLKSNRMAPLMYEIFGG